MNQRYPSPPMPCDVIDLPRWLGGPLGTLPVRGFPMHPVTERVGRWALNPVKRWALLAPFAAAYIGLTILALPLILVGAVPMLVAEILAKAREKAWVCMKLVIINARVMYERAEEAVR